MGDLINETKGNIKEGVGKVTGNEQMQREGQLESDAAKTQRQVKGGVEQVQGKVEEGVGKLTGDQSTVASGKAKQVEGDARRSV